VESTTNQSFVTRQLIKKTLHLKNVPLFITPKRFTYHLKTKLQDRYLHIDRNKMDINALELLVKHGLNMEELLIPLHDAIAAAKIRNKMRKDQENSAVEEDFKIIEQIASMKLRVFERYLFYLIFILY
jgi:hypothetical protein